MKTVLFVDDDEGFRRLCKRIFEEEGYRVVLAEDGAEAIKAVTNEHPNVVILDVRMPRRSGLDVAEEISAIAPHLPIILYTANDEICTIDPRSRLAVACVEKSSDFSELVLAISRVLAPRRQCILGFGLPQA